MNPIDKLRMLIFGRQLSYKAIFLDKFGKVKPEAVYCLADLKRFCCADSTTVRISPKSGQIDPLAMAMAEGRREVFMRIQHYLRLDEQELLKMKEERHDD